MTHPTGTKRGKLTELPNIMLWRGRDVRDLSRDELIEALGESYNLYLGAFESLRSVNEINRLSRSALTGAGHD